MPHAAEAFIAGRIPRLLHGLAGGFCLWISYGIAAGNLVLVIPNRVALLVGTSLVVVALRLRRG